MRARGTPDYGMQDGVNLQEIDYDGNIVWQFDRFENIDDPGRDHRWMARQHHDFQREGNPVGYYVPGMDAKPLEGNTLILAHQTLYSPNVSDKKLLDDCMYEVDWEGNIVWKWSITDHFDELGFDEAAKNVLARDEHAHLGRRRGRLPARELRRATWGRTSGTTRATCASSPTTSSSTRARPTSWPSSTRRRARSCGRSARLPRHPRA